MLNSKLPTWSAWLPGSASILLSFGVLGSVSLLYAKSCAVPAGLSMESIGTSTKQ